jgi:Tetracyclin repressor-like, C-terminal domain
MAGQFGGMSEEEQRAVLAEFTERVRQSGRYPHMVAMMTEGIDPDAAETRDARFEFGLDCLLDGLAARIQGGAAP